MGGEFSGNTLHVLPRLRAMLRAAFQGAEDHRVARTVLVVAHLPPPVHGMAVAVDTFAKILEDAASSGDVSVQRISIAGARGQRNVVHHLLRVARVCRAAARILRARRGSSVYMSVDAGSGMVYTLFLAGVARMARSPLYLHHHSAAYFRERRAVFSAVCRFAAPRARHLVGCEAMAAAMRERYPSVDVDVLPILYAVEGSGTPKELKAERPVVLGHLSNITRAKGIEDVFGTAGVLRARGDGCHLLVAGPALTPDDQALLETGLQSLGPSAQHLGAVHGAARERFFNRIDVFLFPSRYVHESFGLVVGEALAHGCAVVTRDTICLGPELVGNAGLVLAPQEEFCESAASWVERLWREPSRRARANEATIRFVKQRDDAVAQARRLALAILGLPDEQEIGPKHAGLAVVAPDELSSEPLPGSPGTRPRKGGCG